MKRRIVFIVLGLVFASLFWGGKKAYAVLADCGDSPTQTYEKNASFTLTFDLSTLKTKLSTDPNCQTQSGGVPACLDVAYNLEGNVAWYYVDPKSNPSLFTYTPYNPSNPNSPQLTLTKTEPNTSGSWDYFVRIDGNSVCKVQTVKITSIPPSCGPNTFTITNKAGGSPAQAGDAVLHLDLTSAKNFNPDNFMFVSIGDATGSNYDHIAGATSLSVGSDGTLKYGTGGPQTGISLDISSIANLDQVYTFAFQYPGDYTGYCATPLPIGKDVKLPPGGTIPAGSFDLCTQIPDPTLKNDCYVCSYPDYHPVPGKVNPPPPTTPTSIWTSVGCIKTGPSDIVSALVKLGLGIAGSAAVLMILVGGFMLSTSQGDTKRVGEAKELITSAVIGLLFIIFSVTLLKFIGITIFNLPGFG